MPSLRGYLHSTQQAFMFFFVFPACYLSRKLCNTLPVTSEQASLTQADKLFNPISNFLFLKFSCWIPFVCLQICVSCFLIFPEKRVYLKAGLFDPAEKLVKTIMACLSSIHIISFLSFIDPFLLAILREQKVCLQIKGQFKTIDSFLPPSCLPAN